MISKRTFMVILLTTSSIIFPKEHPLRIKINKIISISSLFENKTFYYSIYEEASLDNHEEMDPEEIFTAGYNNGFDDALNSLNENCVIITEEEMNMLLQIAEEYINNFNLMKNLEEENNQLLAMNGINVITGYVLGIISSGLLYYIISLRSQLSTRKETVA
jgi:hypothetical protein